jgi:hypothetical protein
MRETANSILLGHNELIYGIIHYSTYLSDIYMLNKARISIIVDWILGNQQNWWGGGGTVPEATRRFYLIGDRPTPSTKGP